jgi:hypothetical protein
MLIGGPKLQSEPILLPSNKGMKKKPELNFLVLTESQFPFFSGLKALSISPPDGEIGNERDMKIL